ncbi:NAD-dependent epimerase/dehydratase family protein [Desulfotignum phosphitoxidans]|uniref:PutativeUDP-glucose 4-epimerase GalE n=1 Tax=Desulfotignum phosphitoxidans DSM 13687 TaxID=1286635 RepID=S0FWY1_9BACT|nr:SDR family oxidoreductase [Desulfotignum phosphitoxidans]EMS77649.1 putativeUDP-glucose 4-epimerase GalE [Desulfotignum phosphitoxidans DSM 13687]
MKILITGNTGYIGPVLVRHLRKALPDAELIGFDSGFFTHCLTAVQYMPEFDLNAQYWGDIRNFPDELLKGVDAVVHLCAVSNDPMGNRFESVTRDINFEASRNLALSAKKQGVKAFVFASSCSMYGYAEGGPRKESDPLNPLTAYARSKVAVEKELEKLGSTDFAVTSLRFSTACGMSRRLRLDLVLNDFVACAVAAGEITVLSDGTPWRPLIDVKDMSRAIDWGISRKPDMGGAFLAVNVGCSEWNYQVKDLAEAVAKSVPGTKVSINTNAQPDKRSYQVDFSQFAELAPDYQPQVTLQQSIEELREGLEQMGFADKNFRESQFMRLKMLDTHIAENVLNEQLFWKNRHHFNSIISSSNMISKPGQNGPGFEKSQESSGFFHNVIAGKTEDVWNDI